MTDLATHAIHGVIELPMIAGAPLFITRSRAATTRRYLESFGSIASRIPGEPAVSRLVDVDCGPGAFAAFAGVRFPYAWLDCFHVAPPIAITDEGEALAQRTIYEDHVLARLNAQVGTRFFTDQPETVPECDALHVGLRAKGLQFTTERLAKLKLALWEWSDSETLESATGLMRYAGLEVVHASTVEPGRGWALFFRKHPFAGITDLTPARGPTPASKEASPS